MNKKNIKKTGEIGFDELMKIVNKAKGEIMNDKSYNSTSTNHDIPQQRMKFNKSLKFNKFPPMQPIVNNKIQDENISISTEERIDINSVEYQDENQNILDGSGGFMKLKDHLPSKINSLTIEDEYYEESQLQQENINENKQTIIKKPESLITDPKLIPKMKLEKIYKYDTVQLVEGLKYIEFKPKNVRKFVDMLSIIRKKREIKIYDFPEILNAINYIRNNMDNLAPSYIVSFIYSISKMQKFDEDKPSLDNQNILYDALTKLTPKLNLLDVRGISNLVFALQTVQLQNSNIYNFDEFLSKLEVPLIDTLIKYKNKLDHQSISNIILAYCKTQNGSEEFYRILQEIVYNMKESFTKQELANIIYSYANNPTCTEKILELLQDEVMKNIHAFQPKELCCICRAYHMKNLMNDKLKKEIITNFLDKHENVNATDLAYFYIILADEKEKKFLNYAHKCIQNLYFTFSGNDLGILSQKADFIEKNNPDLYKLLQKQVIKLINKKSIKGFDLKKIYEGVKDLPFEGKYNIFVEEIEKHLAKLKYY